MKNFLRTSIALAMLASAAIPANAATVTVTNNAMIADASGKHQVATQTTTVATFTTAQNVAQVTITEGLWQCNGIANMGTETNASVINLGISKTTGALPVANTDGVSAFASIATLTTQANATAGFPQLTTGPAYFSVLPGKPPVTIFLVESQTVTDTVTAALQCAQISAFE